MSHMIILPTYSIHTYITDCVTVTSLAASLLQKISVATDRPCQIVLNRKICVHSKSAVNFQVALKQNHTKSNHIK